MRKTGVRYIAVPLATVALATALGGGTPSVATAAEALTAPAATTQAATAPAATDEAAAETPNASDTDATTAAATTDAVTTAEAQQQATTPDSQGKVVATLTRANGIVNYYDSIEKAVAGANWWGGSKGDNKAATLTFTQSVTDYQRLDFKSPVNITAADGVTINGTIVIEKTASRSTIKGVHFQRLDGREGNFNSVEIKNAHDVEVSGSVFDSPSALGKVKEWQYNGVWADGNSYNITVANNHFNLGRMNDTNGSGDTAQDINANTGVNLVGGGDGNIHDVTLSGNILTVGAPAANATRTASVNLLIANGNATDTYGIKNVTVTGNTYDGSADKNNDRTRVAGISNVDGFTFENNTVTYARQGAVAQSVWQGSTTTNKNFSESGNTYGEGVPDQPIQANITAADVTDANGKTVSYDSFKEAVDAANKLDGATVKITKSVTDNEIYTFKKKVNVTASQNVTFGDTLAFAKGASGSTVKSVHFVRRAVDKQVDGINSVKISGATDVEVSGNTFDSPSEAVTLDEYDAVWVESDSQNIKISGNTFNFGRLNHKKDDGTVNNGSGSNAINLVGGVSDQGANIKNVEVSGNTLTASKSADGVIFAGEINLVVANGNGDDGQFGVANLTVSNNNYDSSAASDVSAGNTGANGAVIAGVDTFTFTGNTIKGASRAVAKSQWGDKPSNKDVAAYGNTYDEDAGFPQVDDEVVSDAYKVVEVQDGVYDASWLTNLKAASQVANQIDGATVTLKKSVTDHSGATFSKKVNLTADKDVTFNGVIRLNGNETTVQGVHFILDGGKAPSGNPIYQSLIVSGADNVKVSDNTFDLKDASSSGQLSSLWLEGSTDGTNISGNTFNIGRGKDSSVGINLVGGIITNTTVEGNTVKLQNNGDAQSSAMGLVANGNQQNNDKFGVTNLTVKGNTIDGSEVPSNKGYGVSIANVDGLTLEGNTIENLYMGLSYSTWGAKRTQDNAAYTQLPFTSKDITLTGNNISNTTAPVYFKATYDNGLRGRWDVNVVPATEVHFTDVQTIKVDDLSKWRGDAAIKSPIVSTVAFVGWYKDARFTQQVQKDENYTGEAYAKYVPVSDLIKFLGGQLRMDNYVNADGTKDYSKADLRLGYDFVLPEGAEYNQQQSGWNYGYDGNGDLSQTTSVQRKTVNPDGSIRANIVLNKVVASDYKDLTFYARANFAYTTFDGTQVRVFDTEVPFEGLKGEYGKRTVDFVAQKTLTDPKATDVEKAYAQGIIDAETK